MDKPAPLRPQPNMLEMKDKKRFFGRTKEGLPVIAKDASLERGEVV